MQIVKGRAVEIVTEGFTWGDRRTAAATQFTTIQLRNPAASGVTMLVRSIVIATAVAQEAYLAQQNALLGTATVGKNLRFGGADGLGTVSSTSEVTQLGTVITMIQLRANETYNFPPSFGFVLPENTGIIVVANTAATLLQAFFVWNER